MGEGALRGWPDAGGTRGPRRRPHGGRRMPVCAEPPAVAEKDDETLGRNGGQATATALATVGRRDSWLGRKAVTVLAALA